MASSMYTIPGTNIQIPMNIASGGLATRYGLPSGDAGEQMAIYSDPALQALNYPGVGFNVTDPTHAMATIPGVGGVDRSLAYTLQDGNWMLNPESLNQWSPYKGGWYDALKPLAFVAGGAALGSAMGLGEIGAELGGLDASTVYGAGSGWGADTLSAVGMGGGAGTAGAGLGAGVMDPYLFSGIGEGTGSGAAAAGGWTPSGLSAADIAAASGGTMGAGAGATPSWLQSLFGTGGAGGLGSGMGLAGSLAQLAGGLYGANQARNISNLAGQATPWITGGGQAMAAQQLQRGLQGDVTGMPGFQLAQRAAMDRASRSMAASGQYGGGAYVPGMATAAGNQYMNYMNMLGSMAGVGQQPNYAALQAGLGGQVSGLSTALQGGLGTLGSLMAMGLGG